MDFHLEIDDNSPDLRKSSNNYVNDLIKVFFLVADHFKDHDVS